MFLSVIVFLTVSIMIPEPLKLIFNFITQYLTPQMYRECRLFYRELKYMNTSGSNGSNRLATCPARCNTYKHIGTHKHQNK